MLDDPVSVTLSRGRAVHAEGDAADWLLETLDGDTELLTLDEIWPTMTADDQAIAASTDPVSAD